ncbi:MAG: PEP-CTERM system histidine kinase PrsK, partial [Sphingorhabdus sp.]|nr:PEP-CTERM system histidine kinase PrsK [Sphingorhabdus sp.]
MNSILAGISFWGFSAAAFAYAALAIWIFHKHGTQNRQQILLIAALGLTGGWAAATFATSPFDTAALIMESLRNAAWLGFMFLLLRSGEGRKQPRTINFIYAVLALLLLCQPAIDVLNVTIPSELPVAEVSFQTALLLRMIFAVGALVAVHNLYTISAPEARWGISLPMAALAAMWTFDLNLYTIAYLATEMPIELLLTRGLAMLLLAPIFVMASKRNSSWRLRLSRSVAF